MTNIEKVQRGLRGLMGTHGEKCNLGPGCVAIQDGNTALSALAEIEREMAELRKLLQSAQQTRDTAERVAKSAMSANSAEIDGHRLTVSDHKRDLAQLAAARALIERAAKVPGPDHRSFHALVDQYDASKGCKPDCAQCQQIALRAELRAFLGPQKPAVCFRCGDDKNQPSKFCTHMPVYSESSPKPAERGCAARLALKAIIEVNPASSIDSECQVLARAALATPCDCVGLREQVYNLQGALAAVEHACNEYREKAAAMTADRDQEPQNTYVRSLTCSGTNCRCSCHQSGGDCGDCTIYWKGVLQLRAAVSAEREECAKIANDFPGAYDTRDVTVRLGIAAAIRARAKD